MKLNHVPRNQRRVRQWIRARKGCRGFTIHKGRTLLPYQKGKVINLLSLYSSNGKLGGELQTWHLSATMHPTEARRGGAGDGCICGTCPFRAQPGDKLGACYPDGRGIASLWASVGRGNYPAIEELARDVRLSVPDTLRILGTFGGGVRLGAYGDPAAMPVAIGQALTGSANTRQGFTHAWRALGASPWRGLVMASCELPGHVRQAEAAGWRTYTVYPPELSEREARQAIANASGRLVVAHCPASERKNYAVTCETCPIQCDGLREGSPWQVINAAHGNPAAMARYHALGHLEKWRAHL